MDINQLKIYNHLAGTRHFGKTSRACHITPSALTRLIQRLEQEVGKALFNRDNRTVELTAAGEAFRRYADDVIQRWMELQNDLIQGNHLKGAISLYGSVTAVYSILPNILTAYRRSFPDVQIHLETGDAAMALTRLQNREVDLAIAAMPGKTPIGVEMMKVTETPLVFIAPRRFPATIRYENENKKENGKKKGKKNGNENGNGNGNGNENENENENENRYPSADGLPEVRDQKKPTYHEKQSMRSSPKTIDWQATPLIVADRGLSRERFDRWLTKERISPTIYAQVAGNEAILAMVSLGCGVGVIPLLVLEKSPLKDEIHVIDNAPHLKPFSIGVCTLKKNMKNPRIEAFWKIASDL